MHIAILTDGIQPYVIGGMQRHSFSLAKFLSLNGHQITLVHCVPDKSETLPTIDDVKREMALPASSKLETICLRFPAAGFLPGHYLKESYLYSRKVYAAIESSLSTFDFIYAKGFSAWHLLERKSRE